ncbi:MAG: TonB-dependent receptor [candidate division KSB1 bacterium]|nr:TonB-dependent receptor [candidate division KSB1 bacterium]
MRKIWFILAVAVLLLGSGQAWAKSRITGKVTDAKTGNGLPGANVFIEDTNIGAATGLEGEYLITNVPPGQYTLIFRYIGYEEATAQVNVTANETIIQDVRLEYQTLTGEEVQVTAQAEGQMQAINQQITANTIKNIVSSDKIQELPEANAAEAVGRLPGISLKREGGEGNKVVIRGLSPKYNKIQIDGVSMAATGSEDRSVDLSMISPNMLEGIEVSKAAMADQEADQLGGTVNFILRGAREKSSLNVTAQGGYNELSDEYQNYHLIVGGGRRFWDNRIGVFAQANLERRDRSDNNVYSGYQMLQDSITIANMLGFQDVRRTNQRQGAMLVLDYKSPLTNVKFSNTYNHIDIDTYSRQEHLDVVGRNHGYNGISTQEDMTVLVNALNVEQYIGDVKLTANASYSRSEKKVPEELRLEAAEANAFVERWTFDDKPIHPTEFQAKAINDTSKILVNWFRQREFDVMEEELSADINAEWGFDAGIAQIQFKVGAKYKNKNKDYNNEEYRIPIAWNDLDLARAYLADEFGLSGYDIGQDFPYRPFIDFDYDPETFMAGDYKISRIPDRGKIEKHYHAIRDLETVRGQSVGKTVYRDYNASIQNDYFGEENYFAAYFMPTIKVGESVTLIPGVRYEQNNTEYTANRADSPGKWSDPFPVDTAAATRENDYFLPMIHAKYKPVDWFDVRASYTQTLSRPSYMSIIPSWTSWQDNLTWNNTTLKPSVSKSWDLYLSFYSDKVGLLTIGGFQKNIKNFVYNTDHLAGGLDGYSTGMAGKRTDRRQGVR